ncbi:protein jagunal [Eurytemora carolleeae]|uniref:protein jagunal n=1 Tax=Eurytemora carolleeae TaxID=1294199 RepID=UPI000C77827D|nr:protein jagunal [Eurytemora carolleeae]|eukprot:XP_023322803.1 protein jagunal-like [Eurytemora affinis]
MASRSGKMVDGTDGTDYQHRERVAAQYQVSAKNKSRLKLFVFIHWLMGGIHILRLLPSDILPLPPFPAPTEIDYAWLISLPFTLVAVSACRKSKPGGLNVFQFAILGVGICPLLITLFFCSPDVLQVIVSGSTKGLFMWNGYPFGLMWSMFCVFCVLVHIAEIAVARTLMAAWAPRHGKKA